MSPSRHSSGEETESTTEHVPSNEAQKVENKADAEKSPPSPPQSDVIPNGGYGWVCVGCCFLINAHTWGMNSAYAVFLGFYLDNNVFSGGSALKYAFIGGLSISMALLLSPVSTIVVRKYGTRVCCFLGVFFETLSFIGASFAKEVWQLFLSQGVCFGFGMGFLFIASVNVPPQWFTTKRSLANGIGAAGSGFGGMVYSLSANAGIKSVGLPWTFRILGIVAFAVNMTCALLIRDRNAQIGTTQIAFDYKLFKRWEFTMLQSWAFLSILGYVVLLFSLPNFASSIGLTSQQGSVVSAIFQLGQMLGRPPVGYFSDTFGRINMAMTMTFLPGLFCLVVWIFATSYGVLLFFAIIGGMVAGTIWATVAPLCAEICGIKHTPSALSITWLVLVLPSTFSEAMALEIVNKSSSKYLGAQLFAGFMYIGAALCLWPVRIWKIGDDERGALEDADGIEVKSVKSSSTVKRAWAWKKV